MRGRLATRALLTALTLIAVAGTPPAAAADDAWRFRVLLDQQEIGTHDFTLARDGDGEVLTSTARYRVKVLFVEAYRYAHDSRETFRGGCLAAIDALTDDNGKRTTVRGRRDGGATTVTGGERPVQVSDCVMTFAYWNPAILQRRQLLNAQTGEYQEVTVTPLGEETLALPDGPRRADRYALKTRDFRIDVWYAARRWVALESRTSSGRLLRYLPR